MSLRAASVLLAVSNLIMKQEIAHRTGARGASVGLGLGTSRKKRAGLLDQQPSQ